MEYYLNKLKGREGSVDFILWIYLLNEKENQICKSYKIDCIKPQENTWNDFGFAKRDTGLEEINRPAKLMAQQSQKTVI